MNWWLVSFIGSFVFAGVILFILGCCWFGDRADDLADYERQLAEGDGCPWPLRRDASQAEKDRASFHHVSDLKR